MRRRSREPNSHATASVQSAQPTSSGDQRHEEGGGSTLQGAGGAGGGAAPGQDIHDARGEHDARP